MSNNYDIDTIEEFKEHFAEWSSNKEINANYNHETEEDNLFLDLGMLKGEYRNYSINPELIDVLKNDVDFMVTYAKNNHFERDDEGYGLTNENLGDVPEEISKDIEFIETAITHDNLTFNEIPQCFEDTSDLIERLIDYYPDQIIEEYYSEGIDTLEVMKQFTESDIGYLKNGSDEFLSDIENLKHYIYEDGAIEYFEDHMHFSSIEDPEIVAHLVNEEKIEFSDIHSSLPGNVQFCKDVSARIELENFEDHLDNKEFVLHYLNNHSSTYERVNCLSDEMLSDKDICLASMKANPNNYEHILNEEVRADHDIALKAIKYNSKNIEFIHSDLSGSKEFTIEAIESIRGKQDVLKHFSDEVKNDESIVRNAVKYDPTEAAYCDIKFLKETGILKDVLEKKANELSIKTNFTIYNPETEKKEVDYTKYAQESFILLKNSPIKPLYSSEYENVGLTTDPKLCLLIADSHITPGFKDKFEFDNKKSYHDDRSRIVKIEEKMLSWETLIPTELKDNKEFMSEMIQRDGYFLSIASNELKQDEDLVRKAISYNPETIKYADDKFKTDLLFVSSIGKEVPPYLKEERNNEYRESYEKIVSTHLNSTDIKTLKLVGCEKLHNSLSLAEQLNNKLSQKAEQRPTRRNKI